MTEEPPPYPPLVAVYPAAEIDGLYISLQMQLDRLESELVDAEAAAMEAEARLAGFEPFDPEVIRRVSAHTDRVVEGLATEAEREAEQLVLDARRVAAQRVGEAAAEAERQIADARAQVERALTMARAAAPPPIALPAALPTPTPPSPAASVSPPPPSPAAGASPSPPNAPVTSAAEVSAVDDEFWHEDQAKPWNRRLPVALLAQLIGAVIVLALILVRLA